LLSNNNLNGLVVGLWDSLRLKAWFDVSSKDIIDELGDNVNGQISWLGLGSEFLHTVGDDSSESWEGIFGDSHEFSKSLLDSISNTSVGEKHLSLVGLGSILESGHESGILIRCRSEQDDGGLLLSKDSLDLILGELKNSWDHKWLDEGRKGVLISGSSIGVLGGLELSEEDNSWSLDSLGLGALGILNVDESDLVLSGSIWEMSILVESRVVLSEVSNNEFVVLDSLGKSIAISGLGWWSRLLGDPSNNGVLGSTSSVFGLLSIPKKILVSHFKNVGIT